MATTAQSIDRERVEEFASELFQAYAGGMLTLMINLADRTGLLDTLAEGSGTSQQLADRADLDERHVRECLGALVTGGIVTYDPDQTSYQLPAEHAVLLTGPQAANKAPHSHLMTLLAGHVPEASEVARTGGGIPYERFRPEFTDVMDDISRRRFDEALVEQILPLADGLIDRLHDGARVADIGCGTGHSTVVMARAFPASTFIGYDFSEDAIEVGRAEAAEAGLANVTFEALDIRKLPTDPPFDAVAGFDVIHDQADPAGVLQRVYDALVPGGVFCFLDIKASSHLEQNLEKPFAPFLYALSTLHCMTVSLAQGGAGLGTVWGQELAIEMLTDAGFDQVTTNDVPDDPLNTAYVAHRPRSPSDPADRAPPGRGSS